MFVGSGWASKSLLHRLWSSTRVALRRQTPRGRARPCPSCPRAIWSLLQGRGEGKRRSHRHVGDGRGCRQTHTHAASLAGQRSKGVPKAFRLGRCRRTLRVPATPIAVHRTHVRSKGVPKAFRWLALSSESVPDAAACRPARIRSRTFLNTRLPTLSRLRTIGVGGTGDQCARRVPQRVEVCALTEI